MKIELDITIPQINALVTALDNMIMLGNSASEVIEQIHMAAINEIKKEKKCDSSSR
jgi:hypothetical protein